jgi:hypothetical protein
LLPTLPIVTFTPPEVRQPAIRTQNVYKSRPAIAKQTSSTALLPANANPTLPGVRHKDKTQNIRESSPVIAKHTARSVPEPAAVNSSPPATVRPKNTTQNVRESSSAITKPTPSITPLPKPPVIATQKPTYRPSKNHLQANALVKGLIIAKRQKSISNAIAAKVQDVIDNLRAGKDIATAAKRSGVRMDKINELLTLAGR